MASKLVVVPTYNEIENIEALIDTVFSLDADFELLVVDDSSPDGTALKVRELMERHPAKLHLEQRTEKSGLGTAYIHGFKWALARNYAYIFEMDADFSHDPKDLPRLLEACQDRGSDVAVGSRYKTGVNVVNWPISRVLLSLGASFYVRLITGMKVYDPTAGFVCYKREVLEKIDLDKIQLVGYAFQIEMKYKAHLLGYKIEEVTVVFTDRVKGESKMNIKIIWEAIFGVIGMKIKSIFKKLDI